MNPRIRAALELLFQTRLLRAVQEGVWAVRSEHIHDVSGCLEAIHNRLLPLSGNLHDTLYAGLRSRIQDRHDAAAEYAKDLWDQLIAEVGSEEAATRLFPARLREKAHLWQVWQEQDWQEMCVLVRKAVQHDAQVAAWGEVGFALADVLCRAADGEAPEVISGHPWAALQRAVKNLPETERVWAAGFLPSSPPLGPLLLGLAVQNAYDDLRQALPTLDQGRASKKQPKRSEIPDEYEQNLHVKKYLDRHPRATIREVAKKVGLSTGKVTQLDAWKRHMAQKRAARPAPKKAERRLTDKMLEARGQDDDPAAKLIEAEKNEAIWQWLLERGKPKEKAQLHRKNPEERAELIELAREQYEEEHREPD